MKNIFAFLLIVAAAAFAAQCSGSSWHYLPAVVDSSGVLVNVSLSLENGSGDTYVSISPKIGLATQDSINTAIDYAYNFTGAKQGICDTEIKAFLPASVGGYIDGPSGGTAFTLMMISALDGKPMREDAMITGTIDDAGNVGPVGGLYEKAKIAKADGLRYFITPPEVLFERVMLRMLQQNGSFNILETDSVTDAAGFMMGGKNLTYGKRPPLVEAVNSSIAAYDGKKDFANLTYGMEALLNKSITKIDPGLVADEKLADYFKQVQDNDNILVSKGYYFSAANDAFLNYLDAQTIADSNTLDVQGKMKEVASCLDSRN